MKILIVKSCAGITFSFVEGQEVTVSDELAKDLISAGYAKADKAWKDSSDSEQLDIFNIQA